MELKWLGLGLTTTAGDGPVNTGLERIKAVKNISHNYWLNIIAEECT